MDQIGLVMVSPTNTIKGLAIKTILSFRSTHKELFEGLVMVKSILTKKGLAIKTILSFRSTHKELFEGLVMVSPTNTIKGVRDAILWSLESVKILMLYIDLEVLINNYLKV